MSRYTEILDKVEAEFAPFHITGVFVFNLSNVFM